MFERFKRKFIDKQPKLSPDKVIIDGVEIRLELNMYTMKMFGEELGVKSPLEAVKKLSVIGDGQTFESQSLFSKLVYHCSYGKISERICLTELEKENITLTNAVNEQVKKYTNSLVYFTRPDESEKKKMKSK